MPNSVTRLIDALENRCSSRNQGRDYTLHYVSGYIESILINACTLCPEVNKYVNDRAEKIEQGLKL